MNIKLLTGLCMLAAATGINAQALDVEERRLDKAYKAMPNMATLVPVEELKASLLNTKKFNKAKAVLRQAGETLWENAKKQFSKTQDYDDRPLYWSRLAVTAAIKQLPQFTDSEKQLLGETFEQASRGATSLDYTHATDKRLLLTGFDPFLLDKNIDQSNPSGAAALALDGFIIHYKGIKAEINTVMIPVRYADFDQGEIEALLAPFYALNSVDLIATISMGREDFDLEHFPGKRRSVTAPDNLNKLSGGNKQAPVISQLHKRPLPGPEFVEYSLPYEAMISAPGPYKINDNRKVITLNKTFEPNSLQELEWEVAVEGGGGGYLSNEISYRSIRLRNQLGSDIPTGHIHTPRIIKYDAEANKVIIEQIKAMLERALPTLK